MANQFDEGLVIKDQRREGRVLDSFVNHVRNYYNLKGRYNNEHFFKKLKEN